MSAEISTWLLTDQDIYPALGDLFEDAEKELIILSPWIQVTGHQREMLKRAVARGVNVTLLTRKPKPHDTAHGETIKLLQRIGVQIFFDNLLHAKMVLMDRGVALIASSNIVLTSMTRNHEIGIVSWHRGLVNQVLGYLERLEITLGFPILSRSDELFETKTKRILKFVSKMFKRKETEEEKTEPNICPWCGKPLVEREGKYGRFWACTGYPKCRYTRNIEWKT